MSKIMGVPKKRPGFAGKIVRALALAAGLMTASMGWAEPFQLHYSEQNVLTNYTGTCPNEIEIKDGCVAIAPKVFEYIQFEKEDCRNINKVTIPASVTSIGTKAFFNCMYLSNIVYKGESRVAVTTGKDAFKYAKAYWPAYENGVLTDCQGTCPADVTIDAGCVSIGKDAFYGRSALEKVTIPASVTNIGTSAFSKCSNLSTIDYQGDKFKIKTAQGAFYGTKAYWPVYVDGVMTRFEGTCPTNLTIDDGCGIIEGGAFKTTLYGKESATNLVSVTLPASVTNIGYQAFYMCSNLSNVNYLGESRVNIKTGASAFYGTKVFWLHYDGNGKLTGFDGTCPTNLTIDAGCGIIGLSAFDTDYPEKKSATNLVTVTLPASVTNIMGSAFYRCKNLETVVCPDPTKVKTASGAFYGTKIGFRLRYDGNGKLTGFEGTCPTNVTIDAGCGIIGEGAFKANMHKSATNLVSVTLPASVTNIQHYAFYSCENLATVVCEGDQKMIKVDGGKVDGGSAFYDTKVFWPEWHSSWEPEYVNATNELITFYGIVTNKTLVIPEGTARIGEQAFDAALFWEGDARKAYASLTNMTEVVIPASVKVIGYRAFADCVNLEKVTYLGNEDDIEFGKDVFKNTKVFHMWISKGEGEGNGRVLRGFDGRCPDVVVIPEGVVEIAANVFNVGNNESVTNLTKVTIPSTVKWIDEKAFYGCKNLKDVVYTGRTVANGNAEGITYGDNVFTGTKSYRLVVSDDGKQVQGFEGVCPATITFPAGVKEIYWESFSSNRNESVTNLVAITVPEGFKTFGEQSFWGCTNLKDVNFTGDIRDISFDRDTFAGAKVYMPIYAYGYCGGFSGTCPANVVIPDGLWGIDSYAFSAEENPTVTNMVSLTLPEGLDYINERAFFGCENLKEVTLPKSVEGVYSYAFANCTYLAKVTALGDIEEYLAPTAFDNTIFRNGEELVDFGLEWNWLDEYTNGVAWVNYTNTLYAFERQVSIVKVAGYVLGYYGNLKQAYEDEDDHYGQYVTNWTYKLEIPAGTRVICDYAFNKDDLRGLAITDLVLPDSIETIGECAFFGCEALNTVTCNAAVKKIEDDAFAMTRFMEGDAWFNDHRMDKLSDEALKALEKEIGTTCHVVSVGGIVLGCWDGSLANWDYPEYKDAYGKSTWTYELVIPEGTRVINREAFYDMCGITSLVLPDSLLKIGDKAFLYCENLKTVTGKVSALEYLGVQAFDGTPFLNGDVEYDSENIEAENDKGLELVVVGDTIIGVRGCLAEAYKDYASGDLTLVDGWEYELVISNGVRCIDEGVFQGLPITSIVLPDTLEKVGAYAFANCNYLKKLDLGEGVLCLGDYAFQGSGTEVAEDEKIRTVLVPASVTEWGAGVFENFGIGSGLFVNRYAKWNYGINDKNIVWAFPVGVNGAVNLTAGRLQFWSDEEIAEYFEKGQTVATKMQSNGAYNYFVRGTKGVLTIPEGVVEISGSMASDYSRMPFQKVVLPSTLEKINGSVFENCTELETVEGGANVEKVAANAFYGTKFLNGSVWYEYNMGRVKEDSAEYKAYINGYEPVVWNGFLLGFRGELSEYADKNNRYWKYDAAAEKWEYTGSFDLVIPEGVKAFADGLSIDCSWLATSLTLPGSLTKVPSCINDNDLSYLKTLTLGEGIEEIEDRAFVNCSRLNDVVLPESMLYVGRGAFAECYELKSVTVGSRDTVIDSTAFVCFYYDELNEYSGLWTNKMCLNTNLTTIAFSQEGYELVGWEVAANPEVNVPYWVETSLDQSKFGEYADAFKAFDVSYWKGGYTWSYAIKPVVKHTNLWPKDDEAFDATYAETYNGYVRDTAGKITGTITFKTQRAKNGATTVSATATVAILGEKKVTIKGLVNLATGVFAEDGLAVKLTANGISGKYGTSDVVGSQNKFVSQDKAEKDAANEILKQWKGNYTMAYADENGTTTLTMSIASKGKVTVKATTQDGTTASTTAQLMIGADGVCNIPVVYEKKNVKLAFTIWLSADGYEVEGIEGAAFGAVSDLGTNQAFYVDAEALAAMIGDDTYADLFPNGISVETTGKKWIVAYGAKAGSDGNLASLKLTYTKKTGAFTGSFNVFYTKGTTKKASKSVKISGVVINGIGFGTAYIKKAGSATVTIL